MSGHTLEVEGWWREVGYGGVQWSEVEGLGECGKGVPSMFLGTHMPKLDDKGRLILPAKFREDLEEGLVVTRTQERALAIYPKATFEALLAPIAAAPSTLKQVRDYQRMLMAGASFEVPDKQGRITIPPILRAYAGLEKDVAVIGAGDRAEIWNAEVWNQYQAEQEIGFAELNAELLSQLGQ